MQVCGLYAIINLILEEPDDGVFAATSLGTEPVRIDQDTVILEFSKLPHIRERVEFASAEHELYGSNKMACIEIATVDSLSLQLNCPHEEFQEYKVAMTAAVNDIKLMFHDHRKRHEKDLRIMESALEGMKRKYGNPLREFTLDLAAKVIKEHTSPG